MRRHPGMRPFGLATFVTVAMLVFVAMAAMTMTRLTALDARRTQQAKAEAERRQLLLAGSAAALARLDAEPAFTGTFAVPLPPTAAGRAASEPDLTVEIMRVEADAEADEAHGRRTVHVRLAHGEQTVTQTLELADREAGWRPVAVAIDRLR